MLAKVTSGATIGLSSVPVTVEVAINEPILLGIELVQKQCGVKVG